MTFSKLVTLIEGWRDKRLLRFIRRHDRFFKWTKSRPSYYAMLFALLPLFPVVSLINRHELNWLFLPWIIVTLVNIAASGILYLIATEGVAHGE